VASLKAQYEERGHTAPVRIVRADALVPIQTRLYALTARLLVAHDPALPLAERLALPLAETPRERDWSALMAAVNESTELAALVGAEPVRRAFERLFDGPVEPFGIARFRAQFPREHRSIHGWHQDEGTWYALPAKNLAHKLPATLWLSLNGADTSNSIEIVPGSHRGHLEDHYFTDGQGYFRAELPHAFRATPPFVARTAPGEGLWFHPLVFHRSVPMETYRPRYSIDIRYYPTGVTPERDGRRLRFRARRLVAR
jgi:hypothetical protein